MAQAPLPHRNEVEECVWGGLGPGFRLPSAGWLPSCYKGMVAFAASGPSVKGACCGAYTERERKFTELMILDV